MYHLVRAFAAGSVEHVEGEVDPVRDMDIISAELRAKDLEIVRKRAAAVERASRSSGSAVVREELVPLFIQNAPGLPAAAAAAAGGWPTAAAQPVVGPRRGDNQRALPDHGQARGISGQRILRQLENRQKQVVLSEF